MIKELGNSWRDIYIYIRQGFEVVRERKRKGKNGKGLQRKREREKGYKNNKGKNE